VSEVRDALRAHLDFYRELGIDGLSRDPVWTVRPGELLKPVPKEDREDLPMSVPVSLPMLPADAATASACFSTAS